MSVDVFSSVLMDGVLVPVLSTAVPVRSSLSRLYPEVSAKEFYADVFRDSFNASGLAFQGELDKGLYCGIACRIFYRPAVHPSKNHKRDVTSHNFYIFEGLERVDNILDLDSKPLGNGENSLTIVSPISYAGSHRTASAARHLYALCIEIDNLLVEDGRLSGLSALLWQIDNERVPRPTYIVASGNGVHLYYIFERPLVLLKNVVKSLEDYRHYLIRLLWNRFVTTTYLAKDIQFESLFQGFRMVGTRTKLKNNTVVRAFKTGDMVTAEYMNKWAEITRSRKNGDIVHKIEPVYKDDNYTRRVVAPGEMGATGLPLSYWEQHNPEWYQRVIVEKGNKKHWNLNEGAYQWWLDKIYNEAKFGHRYYALFFLAVYGVKSGIPENEVRQDCYDLLDYLDRLTPDDKPNEGFTLDDIEAAMRAYVDDYRTYTYPIKFISERSAIPIEKNKRNGRKQKQHLRIARVAREMSEKGYDKAGRPVGSDKSKRDRVKAYIKRYPDRNVTDISKRLGISRPTVYKYLDEIKSEKKFGSVFEND